MCDRNIFCINYKKLRWKIKIQTVLRLSPNPVYLQILSPKLRHIGGQKMFLNIWQEFASSETTMQNFVIQQSGDAWSKGWYVHRRNHTGLIICLMEWQQTKRGEKQPVFNSEFVWKLRMGQKRALCCVCLRQIFITIWAWLYANKLLNFWLQQMLLLTVSKTSFLFQLTWICF